MGKQGDSNKIIVKTAEYQREGGKISTMPDIARGGRKKVNRVRVVPPRLVRGKPNVAFHAGDLWDCSMCHARACCRALCPPMEWRVSLVEVEPSKEFPVDPSSINLSTPPEDFPDLSTPQKILQLFFIAGLRQSQISDILGVSRQRTHAVINKYEPKIKEFLGKIG